MKNRASLHRAAKVYLRECRSYETSKWVKIGSPLLASFCEVVVEATKPKPRTKRRRKQ